MATKYGNLAELKKKQATELQKFLKEILGNDFKEEDFKDKPVEELAQLVLDKEFETRHKTLFSQEKKSLIQLLEETRVEAKNNRIEKEKAQKEKQDILNSANDVEINKLISEGKHDDAIAKLNEKIKGMSANYDEISKKAQAYDNIEKNKRAELKTRLGDKYKEKYDKFDLDDLEEIANTLAPVEKEKDPPPTNQSNQTTPQNDKTSKQSPEEKIANSDFYTTKV